MSRFTKGAHEGLVPVLHDYDEYRSDNENEEDDCRESAELRFYAGRLRKENGISFEKISSRSAFVLFFKTFSSSASRRVVLLRCITSQALHTARCRLCAYRKKR